MLLQKVLEFLSEQGYNQVAEEDVTAWINAGLSAEQLLMELVGPEAVDRWKQKARSEGLPDTVDDPRQVTEDDAPAVRSGVEILRSGDNPDALEGEEAANYAELVQSQTQTELQSLIAGVVGNVDPRNVGWMFENAVGITIDSIDWSLLFDIMQDIGGTEFTENLPQRLDGVSDDEYKRQSVFSFVSTGPTALNSGAWQIYLEQEGNWANTFMVDGMRWSDILDYSDRLNLRTDEITSLGRTGRLRGVELAEAADLYEWAKASGLDPAIPGRRTRYAKSFAQMNQAERADYLAQERTRRSGRTPATDQGLSDFELGRGNETFTLGFGTLVSDYNRAMGKYGNSTVAKVAMHSADLAERLYNDPYSLSVEELRKVNEYIGGADANSASDPYGSAWLADRLSGAAEQTVAVNKDGVREAARTIASSWNLPGLSDAQLDRIVSSVVGPQIEAAKRALGNPFQPELNDGLRVVNTPDPQSAAKEYLRKLPEFQELFANLRDGEDPADYANRFLGETQQFLGDTDPELARVGMKTGDRNTIGKRIVVEGTGADNSTWLGRMARFGEAFRGET